MKAVVFANRLGAPLAPLTDRTCVALLPVVGKAVVEHTIEALAVAGLRDVFVVLASFSDEVGQRLGDGSRWGMQLHYVLTRGDEHPDTVLQRLASQLPDDFLVVRGDILRSASLHDFLAAAATVEGERVTATIGGCSAGLWLVRSGHGATLGLPATPDRPDEWQERGPMVDIEGAVALLDSLAAYHRANLDAAAGRFPGLIVPGRTVAPEVVIGRQSRMPPDSIKAGPAFIGSRCEIKPGAELRGEVVLCDDVVVDRRATLRSALVLPHTYIGELVDVSDAIVWTNLLIPVASGTVTRVPDAFLLADLKNTAFSDAVGNLLHRVLGALALVLSLPLWPIAFGAALVRGEGGVLRRVRLLGNRIETSLDGTPHRLEFVALEMATPIPILRHLPKLLNVVRGDLRLVGVPPISADEASRHTEAWQRLRADAPVGLVGPSQLTAGPDAPEEERLMLEAYYARTRSATGDLIWLLRGVTALFSGRAWRVSHAAGR